MEFFVVHFSGLGRLFCKVFDWRLSVKQTMARDGVQNWQCSQHPLQSYSKAATAAERQSSRRSRFGSEGRRYLAALNNTTARHRDRRHPHRSVVPFRVGQLCVLGRGFGVVRYVRNDKTGKQWSVVELVRSKKLCAVPSHALVAR